MSPDPAASASAADRTRRRRARVGTTGVVLTAPPTDADEPDLARADTVLVTEWIARIGKPAMVLERLRRTMRPGAELVIVAPHHERRRRRPPRSRVVTAVRDAGWTIRAIERFDGDSSGQEVWVDLAAIDLASGGE